MGGLMTFALNALYPGVVTRAVINDIGPEIAEAGLERIKSYVGIAGPFADWNEATRYLKQVNADIFPLWDDDQWAGFARQCYIERDDQVVIDYDPLIAEPLASESSPGMEMLTVPDVGHAPMLNEPGVAKAISVFLTR